MGSDFVPKLNEGDLVLNLARNSKQGIDASVISQKKAEQIIMKHPEVERVFSRIGTAESATDPMGVYLADTFIILKKEGNAWKEANKEALAQRLKSELHQQFTDQEVSATQPIEMRFNEMLEGSRADVTLRVIGPDLSTLMNLIEQAKKEIEGIHGVESVESDPLTALKKSEVLNLEINHLALSRYGVNISDLNQTVELAMGGKQVGSFFEGTIPFPIRIHLDESLRNNIEAIKNIPVLLPQGGTIPLSTLTDFSIKEQVTTIAHVWGDRYAAISIDISGRDVSSVVNEAKSRIEKSIQLPEGYQFYWGGQFKNLSRAQGKLAIIVPITLFIVFAILLKNFGNLSQTLLVFSSVPFAAVGGVFALYMRDIPFSVSAAVGFIALIGIALLNSIVLVTVFHQLKQESPERSLREIVEEGALLRLRPVLMTALVASLGFLPMAFNQGLGAEVQRPLATVVMGGLMTSTLLTLLLLPTLYLGLETKKTR
jgi:cobalt-zinc-cadmium resistance protein CzcA